MRASVPTLIPAAESVDSSLAGKVVSFQQDASAGRVRTVGRWSNASFPPGARKAAVRRAKAGIEALGSVHWIRRDPATPGVAARPAPRARRAKASGARQLPARYPATGGSGSIRVANARPIVESGGSDGIRGRQHLYLQHSHRNAAGGCHSGTLRTRCGTARRM